MRPASARRPSRNRLYRDNDFAFICASRRNDAVHIQRTQRVGVVEREVGDWDGRDRRRCCIQSHEPHERGEQREGRPVGDLGADAFERSVDGHT